MSSIKHIKLTNSLMLKYICLVGFILCVHIVYSLMRYKIKCCICGCSKILVRPFAGGWGTLECVYYFFVFVRLLRCVWGISAPKIRVEGGQITNTDSWYTNAAGKTNKHIVNSTISSSKACWKNDCMNSRNLDVQRFWNRIWTLKPFINWEDKGKSLQLMEEWLISKFKF
jgi:hypothetical protein